MYRKRRRREWDMGGWREWEIVIDEMGGEEEMGGSSAAKSNVDEVNGTSNVEGMNMGVVGDVEGEGMDGGGRGGRRQRVRLPLKDPVSRRVPLRGRRRGAKAVKEQDERRMAQHMLKWLDTNQRRET